MKILTRIYIVLIIILFLVPSLIFMVSNDQVHQLMFLEWSLIQTDVGVLILLALVFGVIIGSIVSFPVMFGLRLQNRRMQKRLAEKQAASEVIT